MPESTDPSPNDAELMARVAHGDRAALGTLIERHQEHVLALAYRFVSRWDVAEDIAQETFLRVFRSAPGYQPSARFTTWLYRIVANLCWDRRRWASRQPVALADRDLPTDAPGGAADLEREERVRQVRAAVGRLADRQRLAVVLHRYEGLSHRRIAEIPDGANRPSNRAWSGRTPGCERNWLA